MIWEAMMKGMAAAAWLVGFVAVTGVLAGLLYVFCAVMRAVFDDGEEAGEDGDDAEAIADGRGGGPYAETVGRHLRRSAGSDD